MSDHPAEFMMSRAEVKIVKKRRANHVQSWRPGKKLLKLCYDTLQPPHEESRMVADAINGDGPAVADATDSDGDNRDAAGAMSSDGGDDNGTEFGDGPAATDGISADEDKRDDDLHDDDNDRDNFVICCDCQCKIPKGYSFPQANSEWRTEQKNHRCKTCWTAFMINDVASEIDNIHSEKERAKFVDKTSAVTGEKRKPIDENSSSTKKKRKKIVKCKWYNSTTHKTKRSKKCPYFGGNATAPVPVPTAKKKVTTPTCVSP